MWIEGRWGERKEEEETRVMRTPEENDAGSERKQADKLNGAELCSINYCDLLEPIRIIHECFIEGHITISKKYSSVDVFLSSVTVNTGRV